MQGYVKLVVIADHHARQLEPVNPVSESADNNYESIVTLLLAGGLLSDQAGLQPSMDPPSP